MILVDLNPVMIAQIIVNYYNDPNYVLNEQVLRHNILNALKRYKTVFSQYGEMVICCDSKRSWRYDKFSYYKAKRHQKRDESLIDWNMIYEYMVKVKDEIKEYMPFTTIDVKDAEADDIIAILVMEQFADKYLILSRDKDYKQLLIYSNVKIFDPIGDKYIEENDPKKFLFEHVCKGDNIDGIPNILNENNCFMIGKRQTPVYQKKIDQWYKEGKYPENTYSDRNKLLIDFSYIPLKIKGAILNEYEIRKNYKGNIREYFIKNKLGQLYSEIYLFL